MEEGGKRKTDISKMLKNVLIVIVSAFIGSSVQIFVMIPNGMTSGGLPGVARLITHFLPDISYSLVYYALSILILAVAYFTMGKKELLRIAALGIMYPVMLSVFERTDYTFLESSDPFLASLLIGVCYGIATGVGYIGGFSSGGTDSLARVLKYKLFNHLRVGDIQMVLDVSIILVSAFVFNMNVAIYAIVNAFIAAKVISMVMLGFSGTFVQFDIISSKPDEISEYIMNNIRRAVTSHISRGEFTKTERRTLSVICTPGESVKIKRFVAETDPEAFATIMPVSTVWGKRFSDINEVDNL